MTDTDDRLVRVNKPNSPFTIETETYRTESKWIIDVQRERDPPPRMFSRVGEAEVALVGWTPFVPDDSPLREPLDDAIDAVQELQQAMIAERSDDLTRREQGDLGMGNIEVLPEVAKSREPNRLDMECPFCRGEDTYEDGEYQLHCFGCGQVFTAHERESAQAKAEGNDTVSRVEGD